MKSMLCKYYQPLRLEKPSNFRLDVRGTVSQLRLFVGLAGVIAGAVCARARDVANFAQDGFTFHDGGLQVGNAH